MVVVSFNSSSEGLLRSADIRDFFEEIHKDNYLSKGELVQRIISKYIEATGVDDSSLRCAFYDDLEQNIFSVEEFCPDVVCVEVQPLEGLLPSLLVSWE